MREYDSGIFCYSRVCQRSALSKGALALLMSMQDSGDANNIKMTVPIVYKLNITEGNSSKDVLNFKIL